MTIYHWTNRPATGTCMYCGIEKPDDELAVYVSTVDMGWHGLCEECHDRREVPVRFWELYRLSELRAGTVFTRWSNRLDAQYCGLTRY